MKPKTRKFFDYKYIHLEKRKANIMICIVLWSVVMTGLIYTFVLGSVTIQGSSMLPNLLPNERKLFHKWVYLIREPKVGEIIVVEDPLGGLPLIKRVMALPGDSIQILSGKVWVNGSMLEERYLGHNTFTNSYAMKDKVYEVEEGHYFLLGDNRDHSEDSRHLGGFSRESVKGKIFLNRDNLSSKG